MNNKLQNVWINDHTPNLSIENTLIKHLVFSDDQQTVQALYQILTPQDFTNWEEHPAQLTLAAAGLPVCNLQLLYSILQNNCQNQNGILNTYIDFIKSNNMSQPMHSYLLFLWYAAPAMYYKFDTIYRMAFVFIEIGLKKQLVNMLVETIKNLKAFDSLLRKEAITQILAEANNPCSDIFDVLDAITLVTKNYPHIFSEDDTNALHSFINKANKRCKHVAAIVNAAQYRYTPKQETSIVTPVQYNNNNNDQPPF